MRKLLSFFLFVSLLASCKLASFKNVQKDDTNVASDDLTADPIVPTTTTTSTISKEPLELEVIAPSQEIKAGKVTMQIKARIKNGPENPSVHWNVKTAEGAQDAGTIDSNGLYTSPALANPAFPVDIIAVLKSDPSVFASTRIKVIPIEQIFATCTRNNVVFPILAVVYQIPTTANRIPNFSNEAEAKKVTTVCLDKYAVAPRNFSEGFPDVPQLFEYFALQTTTKLVIKEEGSYTFQLNSDDGSRLILNEQLLIDNDGLHQALGTSPEDSQTMGQKEASLSLKAGEYPLKLDYFQGPKFRLALELKWKKPGATSFEYVPREAFR